MDRSPNALRPFAGLSLAIALAVSPMTAAPAEAAGGGHGPVMDGPFYVRPRPVIAPMLVDGGIVHIGVQVVIETPDKDAFQRARDVEPRLMNAFVTELNSIVSGPWVRDNGVDHAIVKRRFLAACVRLLGSDTVKDVLIEKSYRRRVS